MLSKVAQCAGRVLANNMPHQLHWCINLFVLGDQFSSSCEQVRVNPRRDGDSQATQSISIPRCESACLRASSFIHNIQLCAGATLYELGELMWLVMLSSLSKIVFSRYGSEETNILYDGQCKVWQSWFLCVALVILQRWKYVRCVQFYRTMLATNSLYGPWPYIH